MAGLAAIVLAAGRATRFGGDKLMRPFRGAPLILHAIDAARAAPVSQVVIVRRPGAALQTLCNEVAARDEHVFSVESENEAMSDSLRAGVAALPDADGLFVFLADMPLIPHDLPPRLALALPGRLAVVPTFAGRPGHPVLLSRRAAELTKAIQGDRGAASVLRQHADAVSYLESADEGVTLDIDTLDDLERLSR